MIHCLMLYPRASSPSHLSSFSFFLTCLLFSSLHSSLLFSCLWWFARALNSEFLYLVVLCMYCISREYMNCTLYSLLSLLFLVHLFSLRTIRCTCVYRRNVLDGIAILSRLFDVCYTYSYSRSVIEKPILRFFMCNSLHHS